MHKQPCTTEQQSSTKLHLRCRGRTLDTLALPGCSTSSTNCLRPSSRLVMNCSRVYQRGNTKPSADMQRSGRERAAWCRLLPAGAAGACLLHSWLAGVLLTAASLVWCAISSSCSRSTAVQTAASLQQAPVAAAPAGRGVLQRAAAPSMHPAQACNASLPPSRLQPAWPRRSGRCPLAAAGWLAAAAAAAGRCAHCRPPAGTPQGRRGGQGRHAMLAFPGRRPLQRPCALPSCSMPQGRPPQQPRLPCECGW